MQIKSFLQYLQYEKRYSTHTIAAYKNDLTQFLNFVQEDVYNLTSPSEVRHTHIRSWMVEMMQTSISTRTIHRKISTLKVYFKFLRKQSIVTHNPLAKVVLPKVAKRLPNFIDEKDLKRLFDDVDFGEGYGAVRDELVMELLYATGMRRSELLALKTNNVQIKERYIKIEGKGSKQRLVPFGPYLAAMFREYLVLRKDEFGTNAGLDLFLTDKGKPLYPKWVYNLTKKYLQKVSTLEQLSPHVLRHSFATHLSNNGADLNAIKELLGHNNLAATQIYTHNSMERLMEVYQQAHPKAKIQA